VAAGLLALALTGCDPAQAGAAAIVDGHRITVAQVQDSVDQLRALKAKLGQTIQSPATLARDDLQRRLILAVYERVAADVGVTVTDGDVSAQLAKARQQAGSEEEFEAQAAQANLSPEALQDYARQQALALKIGAVLLPNATGQAGQAARDNAITARLVQTAKKMKFDVNPRYGRFDPNTGTLVDRQDDFLQPTASATPAP
jgi:FKBP-type peptidyl-prolyl cis-trans isomerase (trigger factor)